MSNKQVQVRLFEQCGCSGIYELQEEMNKWFNFRNKVEVVDVKITSVQSKDRFKDHKFPVCYQGSVVYKE